MKTLTEFPGMTLKNAAQTRQNLIAGGKTPEELPAALGEALKLEGDKLTYLVNALEMISDQLEDLKRVVIFTLNEGEKAPQGAVQKNEQYFLVEYYPSLAPKKRAHPDKEGPRGKGDQKRKKRRGGRGGRRPEKPQMGETGKP